MAKLIEWGPEFSVHVESVDAQHKVLVNIINELHEAISAARSDEAMAEVFVRLTEYTAFHFKHEETIMREHDYLNLAEHKEQHDGLIAAAMELQDDFDSGRKQMDSEIMAFLRTWLTEHIQGADKALGLYVAGQGVG